MFAMVPLAVRATIVIKKKHVLACGKAQLLLVEGCP